MSPLRLSLALAVLASLTAAASSATGANTQPGISYDLGSPPAPSPAEQNQLDIHLPDGTTAEDRRPVVVYVHGGSWRAGDKDNAIGRKVGLFTGAGYVFVSVNYRLSPNPIDETYPADRVRFPDHPDDIGEAIGWIDRNIARYGGDPTRIALIGHSAGAHLVSMVSTDPSYVERYGVEPWQLIGTVSLDTDAFDVADRIGEGGANARATFFSAFATPAENEIDGAWSAGSPLRWADPGDPEHLLVTQAGNPNRSGDTAAMASALGQDPATSVFLAPYDHEGINDAVGSPNDPAGETAAITTFLTRAVATAKAPRVRFVAKPDRRIRASERRTRVRFRFRSSVDGSSFRCRLDGGSFRRCRSPKIYRVSGGRHRFEVRPYAPSGRPGKAAKIRFRVL